MPVHYHVIVTEKPHLKILKKCISSHGTQTTNYDERQIICLILSKIKFEINRYHQWCIPSSSSDLPNIEEIGFAALCNGGSEVSTDVFKKMSDESMILV